MKEKFGLENVNAVFRWSAGKGAVILAIKSAVADKVVDGIYRQLKTSAKMQFSGRRPAMLYVQLRDFDANQLTSGLDLTLGAPV